MRTSWTVWIGAAALSAACASTPAHTPEERAAAAVATAPVELAELASPVEAGGIVRARTTALIASRVMAPIVDVRVSAGDRVRRGDVLITLDARDLRANDRHAQAAVVAADESVRAAEADVNAADAAAQLARVTHDRVAMLQGK